MGFFFLSFFALQALAATEKSQVYDLPALFEHSTQHVTRLKIEESKLKAARAGNREALGEILPKASFLGSYTRQDKGGTVSSQNQTNGRFNVQQPLFRGFQEFFALSAAKAGTRAQEYSLQWAKAMLMKDIADLYFSILQAESAERLMQ